MEIKIEYLPINKLTPYEKNARKHADYDVEQIMTSIKKYGFSDPIGIWSDKNIIVEGHGRLCAAKRLKMKTVPCIRLDHLTDQERKEYAIIHNKTAELSEWDVNILTAEIPELDFSDFDIDWGFEDVNADDFGDSFSLADGEKNPICQMTLTLHEKQKELLEWAMANCGECTETFGNTNKQGNQVYEVVKQWADAKKSK